MYVLRLHLLHPFVHRSANGDLNFSWFTWQPSRRRHSVPFPRFITLWSSSRRWGGGGGGGVSCLVRTFGMGVLAGHSQLNSIASSDTKRCMSYLVLMSWALGMQEISARILGQNRDRIINLNIELIHHVIQFFPLSTDDLSWKKEIYTLHIWKINILRINKFLRWDFHLFHK